MCIYTKHCQDLLTISFSLFIKVPKRMQKIQRVGQWLTRQWKTVERVVESFEQEFEVNANTQNIFDNLILISKTRSMKL